MSAGLSPVDWLSCIVQPVVSAVHILEHMVSEIPCPCMVHPLRECAMFPVAAVFLLSGRGMAKRHVPVENRVLCARPQLSGRLVGSQPLVASFQTVGGIIMKKHPRQIMQPSDVGLTDLTPAQLNQLHFSVRHTVLTPELLARASGIKSGTSAARQQKNVAP